MSETNAANGEAQGADGADASAEIARLTTEGIDALQAGDKWNADAAFQKRDEIARAATGETVSTVMADRLGVSDRARAFMDKHGGAGSRTFREAMRFADAEVARILENDPDQAVRLEALEPDDHDAALDFLDEILEQRQQGGGDAPRGTATMQQQPTPQADIQAQIDALNKAVPAGSRGYTDPRHQAKLQGLYNQLYGGTPVVGAGGRNF